MRLSKKKFAELTPILKAWLDENGPAIKQEIASGLGWSYDLVDRVIQKKPDWLVSPGFISKRHAKIIRYHSKGPHKMGKRSTLILRTWKRFWILTMRTTNE